MAKKNVPTITHTEILCRAIRSLEDEIKGWEKKFENLPIEQANAFRASVIEPLLPKVEMIKSLYRIETGEEYC